MLNQRRRTWRRPPIPFPSPFQSQTPPASILRHIGPAYIRDHPKLQAKIADNRLPNQLWREGKPYSSLGHISSPFIYRFQTNAQSTSSNDSSVGRMAKGLTISDTISWVL